jgi:hypothetical protein
MRRCRKTGRGHTDVCRVAERQDVGGAEREIDERIYPCQINLADPVAPFDEHLGQMFFGSRVAVLPSRTIARIISSLKAITASGPNSSSSRDRRTAATGTRVFQAVGSN